MSTVERSNVIALLEGQTRWSKSAFLPRSMVIPEWIERAATDRLQPRTVSETARRLEISCQGLFTFQTRGYPWKIILFLFPFIFLLFVGPSAERLRRYFSVSLSLSFSLRFDCGASATSRWKRVRYVLGYLNQV